MTRSNFISFLTAGAAQVDITPSKSMFLYGYPHVARHSTGVHDPLLASALYVNNGKQAVLFVANDLIWVPRVIVLSARRRICEAVGVPETHIMISATHTHSGPNLGDMLFSQDDPHVPGNDPAYAQQVEDAIVRAGIVAVRGAKPAVVGLGRADATGIGTNRHDPDGPANLQVPVLAVRAADSEVDGGEVGGGGAMIGLMLVCNMHPTVLHEDSTVYSGDFPGLAREFLQGDVVGVSCPIVYHMGTAGNQSPRHVTRANTMSETQRLGEILGKAVKRTLDTIDYQSDATIHTARVMVDLPLRDMPSLADAEMQLSTTVARYEQLQADGAARTAVRTAECDVFGAEETVALAKASADGEIVAMAKQAGPAEIQQLQIGDWKFIGWPGEVFIEFGEAVRAVDSNAFIITLAGGDTQGYLVTQEAIDRGYYEANNAVYKSPESPQRLVDATLELLGGAFVHRFHR